MKGEHWQGEQAGKFREPFRPKEEAEAAGYPENVKWLVRWDQPFYVKRSTHICKRIRRWR